MSEYWRSQEQQRAQTQVEKFLSALEEQSRALLAHADKAEKAAAKGVNTYAEYKIFLEKALEFEAFAQLIEDRFGELKKEVRPLLRQQFDRITLYILNALVRHKLKLLQHIRAEGAVPIGARNFFEADLRRIDHALARADDPASESRLSGETVEILREAREIVTGILARTMSLNEFPDPPPKRRAW